MEQQQTSAPESKSRWKNLTPEELSERGRKAAAARKNPGRPKGSKNRPLEERLKQPRVKAKYVPREKKPRDPAVVRARAMRALSFVKNWGYKDPEKYFSSSDKATAIRVLEFDRRVLRKLAKFRGITLVKLIHNFVLKALAVSDYKELFAEEIAEYNAKQAATQQAASTDGGTASGADNTPATTED